MNRKKYWLIVVLFLNSLLFSSDAIVIPSFCEQYHERRYLIIRLEKSVQYLKQHERFLKTAGLNEMRFKNGAIINCVKELKKSHTLAPLLKEWEKACSYKYLHDKSYGINFARLIFTLQNHMIAAKNGKRQQNENDLILCGKTYTEATTIRNYYSHRIKKTITLLRNIKCSNRDLFDEKTSGLNCILIHRQHFKNPQVIKSIEQIERAGTLRPLFNLFNDFSSCKFAQNEQFIREFISLIFITLRNLITNNAVRENRAIKKNTLELITHIYNNLENVSVEELLDAIDILTEELPPLLEKYQFFSTMSWKVWLKKYWWVPPTLCAVLGMRLYWKHLHPHDSLPHNPLLPKK